MEAKESFDQLCQQLQLEEGSREKAWNVWESVSTKIVETTQGALIPWFICAIYVTNCHEKFNVVQAGDSAMTHSMSKLLKVAKMRIVEFFQKMKVFLTTCETGNTVTENLTELKKTFCISAALFYKFKRVMQVVFKGHQALDESEERKETFCKTCWLLFIVCKGWHLQQVTDLVTAFNLLLCCVDYVHRRFFQKQPTGFLETNGNLEHGILQDLCQESNVPYFKVNAVYTEYFQPFLESCSERNTKDLLNVTDLNSMYEEIYDKSRDVDERDFFDKDGYLWIPFDETDSVGALNRDAANTSVRDEPQYTTTTTISTTTSPESRGPYLSGPSSLTDLRATLEEASHMPSQELIRFWMCCQRNPQDCIQSQLIAVQDCFIKGFNDAAVSEDSNISIQIFVLTKKLYYRVMEAMLLAEERRLSCSDFSALLNSKAFHISLMACSLEVVMADKGLPWPTLAFPWILGVLNLEAFDFFKVIESFILHEPLLGSNLMKHLNRIEEQVLESLAWTTASPLLTALEAFYPHSDPETINSGEQRKKSQPLNLFLRKVNQLAYNRLTSLCNKLEVDDVLRGHMWTCLEQSLRIHWQLMRDRHLDQMLLCAVYAISKVVGKEIQFKQIVSSYKGLPFACVQVYRGSVFKEQDSIIGFYNKVFMAAMKSIILQFAPNKNPPVSPAPKSSARIPGNKNFYLSPLRNSPSETLTPKSRSLYSFGESPGSGDRESLSRINASMRAAANSPPKLPQKRLRFDDNDTSQSGPVLTNGHSTETKTGSHVNGSNGSNDEAEEQESESTGRS